MTDAADTTTPMEPRPDRRVSGKVVRRAVVCVILGMVLSFVSALPVLWVREVPGRRINGVASGCQLGLRIWYMPSAFSTWEVNDQEKITKGFIPWWSRLRFDDLESTLTHIDVSVGIPMPVLSGGRSYCTQRTDNGRYNIVETKWGVEYSVNEEVMVVWNQEPPEAMGPNNDAFGAILPTRIIWRGLIGNTIFYGVIVWLVFALLGRARRAIRRHRDRCEGCGYSLDGLERTDRCPECGHAFRARRIEAPVS